MNGTVGRALVASSARAHPSTHSPGAHCLAGATYVAGVGGWAHLVPLHVSC